MGWRQRAALLVCLVGAGSASAGERIVLAVGDSLSVAPEGGTSFVERLAIPGTRLVNLACSGASSADWLRARDPGGGPCFQAGAAERLDPWLGEVALVHVLIGTNDSYGFEEPVATPPEDYGRNLDRLVSRFEAPVILSVPPPNFASVRMLVAYREEIRRVVAAHAHVSAGVDFLGELPLKFLHDGVHPDAAGHAFMADLLRPLVKERLGLAD
jgi:lysophospholipase L1-like esterase